MGGNKSKPLIESARVTLSKREAEKAASNISNLANKTTAIAVNNTRIIKFINLIFIWIKDKKLSIRKLKNS